MIVVDKEKKTACIFDIAVPGDNKVETKEVEKHSEVPGFEKGTFNQVKVIPIVVGGLGTASNRLKGFLEKIGTVILVEMLQKTVLLGIARISRRIMDMKEI